MNGEPTTEIRFFHLSSRIGRMRYLAYGLGLTLLMMVPALIGTLVLFIKPLAVLGSLLLFATYVAALVFSIAFMVRRLHDMDASGWWTLLVLLPLVNLVFVLVLLFYPGSDGDNRFGPRPPPNSMPVLVAAWCYILIFPIGITGILAAIAIPAYQDFLARSQSLEGIQLASSAEAPVTQYYQDNKAWPTDLSSLYGGAGHSGPLGRYVDTITPATSADGSFGVIVTMKNEGVTHMLAGKSLELWTNDNGATWHCGPASSNPVDARYLTSSCRESDPPPP